MNKKLLIIGMALVIGLTGCAQVNSEVESEQVTTQSDQTTVAETTTKSAETSVEKLNINGADYVYGTDESLEFDGNALAGVVIGDTGIYYASVGDVSTDLLYGTSPMTYYEYYAAELGESVEDLMTDTKYDAITSASSLEGSHSDDYPTIINYKKGTDLESDPMVIDGLDIVDISVDMDTYAKGKILAAAGKDDEPLALAVSKITLNDDAATPAYNNHVKALNEDGTYSKSASVTGGQEPMSLESIVVSPNVDYDSPFGHYTFQFYMEGFDMDDESADNSWVNYMNNIYDITIQNADGKVAGGIYFEDIWVEHGKQRVELAVANGEFSAPRDIVFTSERYTELFIDDTMDMPIGDYTFTIKSRGYEDLTTTATVATRLTKEQEVAAEEQIWQEGGNTVAIDASALPEDFVISKVEVKNNRKAIAEGVDFTYNSDTKEITILDTDMTGVSKYYAKAIDEKYQPAEFSITLKSTMTADKVSYDGDKIVMAEDSPATLDAYLKNINRVYAYEDGQTADDAKRLRIRAKNLINEDGTFNYEATSRDEPIFEDGKTYNMILNANGYDDVTLMGITKK